MKILVIGSGGREHALVWKLAQSKRTTRLWCAPGNAGIAEETLVSNSDVVKCVPIPAQDIPSLLRFALERQPDMTVVGPDNPLALGIVDQFQGAGLRIWGPNRLAARFESSKAFAQEFMERWGIPTARSGVFRESSGAKEFAATLDGCCAVKADGLALGKGVIICRGLGEAHRAIDEMMLGKTFGDAGSTIVIQELLEGTEVSLHALCDGRRAELFPSSQDHKRALDGDRGLNTGGMGAYSPTPFISFDQMSVIRDAILQPWLEGCRSEGIDFRGLLYPGLMLTSSGPKVLEFNARFGDPETQVYLTRLDTDMVDLLEASMEGRLDRVELRWNPVASCCVVIASGGYPGVSELGKPILGLPRASQLRNVKVFHAGTVRKGDALVTSGGRVLGVTAWSEDLRTARQRAYEAVELIEFEGMQYRKDIGAKAL